MSFHRLNGWVQSRLTGYQTKSAELQSQIGRVPQWQHRYLTESLMSEIWLTWCLFSRNIVHKSIRGTKARDSRKIVPRVGSNTWQTIGHQSRRAAKSENHLTATPSTFLMRQEPTWGDSGSIIKIINTLMPANHGQLATAYGLPLMGPRHLQLVRNCAAHKTVENLVSLRNNLSLTYSFHSKATPAEVAWSLKTGTPDLAIDLWIGDMKTIADVATATG